MRLNGLNDSKKSIVEFDQKKGGSLESEGGI